MTSGLRNSAGTDFDSLFATGQGNQLFYIYANDGTDVGQRYLPASSGSSAASCSFLESNGNDIGPKLCKIGTQYTHLVTVGKYFFTYTQKEYYLGYSSDTMGAIAPNTLDGYVVGSVDATLSTDGGYSNFDCIIFGNRPFTGIYVTRKSTGVQLSLSFYQYRSAFNVTVYRTTAIAGKTFFTDGDIGQAVPIVLKSY